MGGVSARCVAGAGRAAALRGVCRSPLRLIEVHLMPFHQVGKDHYRRLGRSYLLCELPGLRQSGEGVASIRRACEIMSRAGLQVFVGG